MTSNTGILEFRGQKMENMWAIFEVNSAEKTSIL